MTSFIRASVKTAMTQREIYTLVSLALPEFLWREGSSDAQGLYVTGIKEDAGQIQFWLDDDAVDSTVSFRGACPNQYGREWKEAFFDNFITNILSAIGEVGDVSRMD